MTLKVAMVATLGISWCIFVIVRQARRIHSKFGLSKDDVISFADIMQVSRHLALALKAAPQAQTLTSHLTHLTHLTHLAPRPIALAVARRARLRGAESRGGGRERCAHTERRYERTGATRRMGPHDEP